MWLSCDTGVVSLPIILNDDGSFYWGTKSSLSVSRTTIIYLHVGGSGPEEIYHSRDRHSQDHS